MDSAPGGVVSQQEIRRLCVGLPIISQLAKIAVIVPKENCSSAGDQHVFLNHILPVAGYRHAVLNNVYSNQGGVTHCWRFFTDLSTLVLLPLQNLRLLI